MKIELESCGNAQAFCDQCLGKFLRNTQSRPCFLTEEDDGKEGLTITIIDGDKRRTFELTPDQRKVIYEPSRDLLEFEISETSNQDK